MPHNAPFLGGGLFYFVGAVPSPPLRLRNIRSLENIYTFGFFSKENSKVTIFFAIFGVFESGLFACVFLKSEKVIS
jgi:hypothetical protein